MKNKKINKLKETIRKDQNTENQHNQSVLAYSVSGGTQSQSIRDDSMIEGELKRIYAKINSFTIEQFQDLRCEIKRQGFNN